MGWLEGTMAQRTLEELTSLRMVHRDHEICNHLSLALDQQSNCLLRWAKQDIDQFLHRQDQHDPAKREFEVPISHRTPKCDLEALNKRS